MPKCNVHFSNATWCTCLHMVSPFTQFQVIDVICTTFFQCWKLSSLSRSYLVSWEFSVPFHIVPETSLLVVLRVSKLLFCNGLSWVGQSVVGLGWAGWTKMDPRTTLNYTAARILRQMVDFQHSVSFRLIKLSLKIPPQLKRVATLPSKIYDTFVTNCCQWSRLLCSSL